MRSVFAGLTLASLVAAQQIGTNTPEVHPPLAFQTCTTSGGCTTTSGAVVLDAGSRSLHTSSGASCNSNGFDRTICPDAATCGKNCALEGVDYAGKFGVTTSGNALSLVFGTSGSRVYLLDNTGIYKNFHVMNQEFSFDVDVSKLPCGFNGALYFSEMPPDGGLSSINKAGAAYGTGYCDSQCPRGLQFINGTVNVDGSLGSCCNEMDLWEANSMATALTPHPCNGLGEFTCTGSACSSLCDPNGCDFNPFRMGNHTLYGPNAIVDTTQKFTVVTQFITSDNTATGTLTEIRRFYVQNGRVIPNSNVNIAGIPAGNSITQNFCTTKEKVLGDATYFDTYGGLAQMGRSLARGAVLVMSLWDDLSGGMTWLDGTVGSSASTPGAQRGACTGKVSANPAAAVIFSNIKVGDIGTVSTPLPPPPPPPPTSPPSSVSSASPTSAPHSSASSVGSTLPPPSPSQVAAHYAQCAGTGYTGPTVCASPYTCTYSNPYYSQCL